MHNGETYFKTMMLHLQHTPAPIQDVRRTYIGDIGNFKMRGSFPRGQQGQFTRPLGFGFGPARANVENFGADTKVHISTTSCGVARYYPKRQRHLEARRRWLS